MPSTGWLATSAPRTSVPNILIGPTSRSLHTFVAYSCVLPPSLIAPLVTGFALGPPVHGDGKHGEHSLRRAVPQAEAALHGDSGAPIRRTVSASKAFAHSVAIHAAVSVERYTRSSSTSPLNL